VRGLSRKALTLRRSALFCAPLVLAAALRAEDALDSDLDALMTMDVSVTSAKALPLRESPGVVSVVTADDIANAGARDLTDVLRLVPGFFSGVDVQGVTSFGLRGLWGQEGKILLLVDGQEFNETLYGSLANGQRLPVDRIQKVEVIRGPGSAVYGGYAELGVINVVMKEQDGAGASLSYGRLAAADARKEAVLWQGLTRPGFKEHLTLSGGRGLRSDRTYTDAAGVSYNMRGASDLDPAFADLGLGWKDFSARLIADRTRTTYQDHYDQVLTLPVRQDFDNFYAELKRPFHPASGWTVTPSLRFKRQVPWWVPPSEARQADGSPYQWHRTADRAVYRLAADYAPADTLSVTAGGEYFTDAAWARSPADQNLFAGGGDAVRYYNAAFFGEAVGRSPFAVVTLGGRYEKNSRVGSVFVPRAALTRVMGRFHVKALYSRAFRAPSLMNLDINPDLRPEKTSALELEGGWRMTDRAFLTANVFDVSIKDPIVYTVDALNNEVYLNFDRTGTRGLELSQVWRSPAGHSAALTYAFYRAHDNRVGLTAVPGHPRRTLAAPNHRATASVTVQGPLGVVFTPSLEYLGGRDGYDFDPAAGAVAQRRFKPAAVADAALRFKRLGVPGLSAAATGHDLFAARPPLVQPYAGGHPPLPAPGREWGFRVFYDKAF
jgi:outer membrane cobalamin receptor